MVVFTMPLHRFFLFSFSFLVNALPLFNFMSLCILLETNYQISYCGELWEIFDNIPCQRLHISQYKYIWLFYKSNLYIYIILFFYTLFKWNKWKIIFEGFSKLTYYLCRPFIIYIWRKGNLFVGENLLRCTTQDEKGLVFTVVIFYPIFWSP
jgi:hypothetical protein